MDHTSKNIVLKTAGSRPDDAHKGMMGTLLSVCGSYGMAGAGLLSCRAALRSGVGLVKWALPNSLYPIAAASVPESVFLPLKESVDGRISADNADFLLSQSADALLLGCGLSLCGETKELVQRLVTRSEKPMVLDADALNALADDPGLLKYAKAPVIITPHPAEMGRLLGCSAAEVNLDRAKTARGFAARYNAVTVLKGAGTVIAAPDGRTLINRTGNSGMATGGSGDVLAGICASFLAQGKKPFDCAAAAVYVHGLAGDLAAERLGKISMLPSDIINELPNAFKVCGCY